MGFGVFFMGQTTMGQNLANFLNSQIDEMATDDTPRSDIIAEMATAAGIEASTVNEILDGGIDCPPLSRLEGFSEVLPVSLSAITGVAEEDGCSYEEERKRSMFSQFTDWLKRELGLTQADQDASEVELAERALSTSQLWSMVHDQLEAIYGWDYWPMDIYYDAAGMPFVAVAVGGKLFRHSIMLDEDLTTIGEAIPVMQEFVPTARTTTTIKRVASGRWRWFSVSASSVLNRVGEIDSRDLFDSFISHADETGEYPIRQFYHAGEAFRTGQADFLARDGNLYITSGLYDETDLAEREVKARQREPEYWGDSIGYLPTDKPESLEVAKNVTIPVYKRGINTEISTLPEKEAANLFTANTEMLEVRRAMLDNRQREAFVELFDGNEDEANAWLDEHAEARNRAIEQDGLITRSDDSDTEAEQEIVNELSDEDIARALEQSEPIVQITETLEEVARVVADLGKLKELDSVIRQNIKQLTDEVQDLTTRLAALEADDETKQREWLENQPRRFNGSVKHIIRPRVARASDEGEPETSTAIVAEAMAAKNIPNY